MKNQIPGRFVNDFVVNASAPIIEIKVLLDCRFSPAKLQLMAPDQMPRSIIMKALNDAVGSLINMQIEVEMNRPRQEPPKPPDLPPAPTNS